MKVTDIQEFPNPNYHVHHEWKYIENWIAEYDKDNMIELNPKFQRGHVWTEDQQIRYVESCLRNGQGSRNIYFNHPNWMGNFNGKLILVDGKQRLEAVRKFMRNELPIFGGNFLSDFDNPKWLLRKSGAHFDVYVNTLKTYDEVLRWYLDLNDGGVVHTQEELDKVRHMLEKGVDTE